MTRSTTPAMTLAPAAAVAVLAALFALAVAGLPTVRVLLAGNSDTLLPAAYMHNLLTSPGTVASFQLPRVPSFVPDLALYGVLFAAFPTWQAASLAYACLSFAGLVLAGGAIVARLCGRPLGVSAGVFLAVSVLAMLLAFTATPDGYGFPYVFAPVVHSGSFVLSLAGLLLAVGFTKAPSRLAGLGVAVLAALGAVSDQLFIGSFLLPLAAGCAFGWIVGGWRWETSRPAALAVGLAVLGCVAAYIADHLLFSFVLVRQPDLPINVGAQLAQLPALLRDPAVHVGAGLGLAATVTLAVWAWREPARAFWAAAGITTAAGFMGLLPLLYVGLPSTRYVQPVWWWGLIALAAGLLRVAPRAAPVGAGLAALGACSAVAIGNPDMFRPSRVTAFQAPVAACLGDLQGKGLIHAGLASYWTARMIAASSNWALQVEQVDSGGRAFLWGNNGFHYAHRLGDPSKAPLFDYVIMQGLDPALIRARFGSPTQVVTCPDTEVWVYPGPDGIGRSIGGLEMTMAPGGLLSGSHCFGPADLSSRSGTVPLEGVSLPSTAPPFDAATWGPYIGLAAGAWQLQLRYSLEGAAKWDITANVATRLLGAGTLQAGPAQVADAGWSLDKPARQVEVRTFLDAGARLRVQSLRLTRAGAVPLPCGD